MRFNPQISALLSIVTGIVFLGAVFYGFLVTSWAVSNPVNGAFSFTTPVALQPTNELAITHAQHVAYIGFTDVRIEADRPLIGSRVFTGIATALPFLIVMIASVGAFILLRRLARQRPFSNAVQWLLGLLALVTVLSAVVIPWFHALASTLAVRQLELPTDGTLVMGDEPWFAERHFLLLQDLDWPLLALGIVLLLVALLWPHAVRMQRDTEGLV